MTYSTSDFAMEVENLCRAHGFKGETLEQLSVFLAERIPPKPQKIFAWMTEAFDEGEWKTGFIAVGGLIEGHISPLVGRTEHLFRGLEHVARQHAEHTNQTTWWRTFTHYIDEEAIYLRKEKTDGNDDKGESQSKVKIIHVSTAQEALDALRKFSRDTEEARGKIKKLLGGPEEGSEAVPVQEDGATEPHKPDQDGP